MAIRELLSDFQEAVNLHFDYIVIGSSFCALGFIEQLLQKNLDARILIVEKGSYCSDIRTLSPKELGDREKNTEDRDSYTFTSPNPNNLIKNVRGINYFVGGRSIFWKAWCPQPTCNELSGWPHAVRENLKSFFPHAKRLLGVTAANEIGINNDKIFKLQDMIFQQLQTLHIDGLRVEHAPLAVIQKQSCFGSYQKFSAMEPLTAKVKENENIKLVAECDVTKLAIGADGKVSHLETSKGTIPVGRANVILAMSTLPSTTLMLNSDPSIPGLGKRFTAHFASYIFARVKCEGVDLYSQLIEKQELKPEDPQMAALYITREKHQFHIQLNAVFVAEKGIPNLDKMRHLLKTPKDDMIESCCNHMVFVCASLGQVDHEQSNNEFYIDKSTGKPTLSFAATETDKELWKTMDQTSFEVLKHLNPNSKIDYWNSEVKEWQNDRPPENLVRHKYLVHPASTMWISDDGSSPVGIDYKVHGVDNVYVTGGALWPTSGSWNPTCAMTALAMHLADSLSSEQEASSTTSGMNASIISKL